MYRISGISTCGSIFICFCKQYLRLGKINDVINFDQSQLLLAKTNEDRTTSRNALLTDGSVRFECCYSFCPQHAIRHDRGTAFPAERRLSSPFKSCDYKIFRIFFLNRLKVQNVSEVKLRS